jgi:hypothetical protein
MSSGGSLAGTIAAEEKMLSLSDDTTRIVADERQERGGGHRCQGDQGP